MNSEWFSLLELYYKRDRLYYFLYSTFSQGNCFSNCTEIRASVLKGTHYRWTCWWNPVTYLSLERKLQFTEFLLILLLSFVSHQTSSTDWWEFSVIILTMSLETLVCAMKHDWQFYFQWILSSKGSGVYMEVLLCMDHKNIFAKNWFKLCSKQLRC